MPRSTKPSSTTPTTAPRPSGSSLNLYPTAHNQPIALAFSKLGSFFSSTTQTTGVKVIGRLEQTADYVTRKGFDVIPEEGWNILKNYKWVADGIKNGQIFKIVSPTTGQNLINTVGRPGPTGFGREMIQIIEAGYKQIGKSNYWRKF